MKTLAPADAVSDAHGLTLTQRNAVDLLAAGKNDTQTAESLGIHRVTVTRWRLYSPGFRAALAVQRAAIWGAAADRLRAMLPKALDALADALDRDEGKVDVALAVLKLAGPLPLVPVEPTDPEDILRRDVDRERERLRKNRTPIVDTIDKLPDYAKHVEAVRGRLAEMALPAEELPPNCAVRVTLVTGV
jgi:hypothetical protein